MINYTLSKTGLKTSLFESLYNEIISNSNTYYYFLGRSLSWSDTDEVSLPLSSLAYETLTRNEIVYFKKVNSTDVSYIIKRYNWEKDKVFDQYDDRLGEYVIHPTCIITAGQGAYNKYITSDTPFDVTKIGIGNLVTGPGVAAGARVVYVSSDRIVVSDPHVSNFEGPLTFTNVSYSGATSLEDACFYCVTSDLNVYKCINNNNNKPSTIKPYGNTFELVKTNDGYVWKYMYSIPTSSINRFMSNENIPVTTALTNQYYSKGSINSVTALSYGAGYSGSVTLDVIGDGYLQNNPVKITYAVIDNYGSGYDKDNPPTVTFDDPFEGLELFQTRTGYTVGQQIKVAESSLIYEVVRSGITGDFAPNHTSEDEVLNGTTTLKFIGKTLTGTTIVNDVGDIVGAVTGITLDGMIGVVNISNQGEGYSSDTPPRVNFGLSNSGDQATAEAVVVGGKVVRIKIANRGTQYVGSTLVSIEPPPGYDPDNPKTVQATANADIFYGWGYQSVPFGYIEDIGTDRATVRVEVLPTSASLYPIIVNDQITGAIINDPGMGYTTASIEINTSSTITSGNEAKLVPNLSLGDLNTRQANVEILATKGTVDSIVITNPGANYYSGSVVVTVEGDGTGCIINASDIEFSDFGSITNIIVSNPGRGYSYANVTITGMGDNIQQAYARAVLSPLGGHGSNAVHELCAKGIAFSTSIALERNQGIKIDNDFRQIGIIKNPTKFNSTERFLDLTGSSCYAVTGVFNLNFLEKDAILWSRPNTNSNKFRIIAIPTQVSSPSTLLIVSLNSIELDIGSQLYYKVNTTGNGTVNSGVELIVNAEEIWEGVAIESITKPTIDKYSGNMILIDNRSSFQPTEKQTITVKTVIRL